MGPGLHAIIHNVTTVVRAVPNLPIANQARLHHLIPRPPARSLNHTCQQLKMPCSVRTNNRTACSSGHCSTASRCLLLAAAVVTIGPDDGAPPQPRKAGTLLYAGQWRLPMLPSFPPHAKFAVSLARKERTPAKTFLILLCRLVSTRSMFPSPPPHLSAILRCCCLRRRHSRRSHGSSLPC